MLPGTRLCHYEILSAIGKGGMGEVWRARDTILGREVAIKTLPEEFARDAGRLVRFEREAKLLASLNHPNIAAIHGFEQDNGPHFLVLELIAGETLADRLRGGAIPLEESVRLALQIAQALEAAHEKGIIHRDLKPANIKVTDHGKVKVLDFGLAKALASDESNGDPSNPPTLTMAATQQGVFSPPHDSSRPHLAFCAHMRDHGQAHVTPELTLRAEPVQFRPSAFPSDNCSQQEWLNVDNSHLFA